MTFCYFNSFDIACSAFNLLSVMGENKIKILIPILILKPALTPYIVLIVFMLVNTGFSYLTPKMWLVPVQHYFRISVIYQAINLALGRD